jgi:trimeric autotransporter adhesin
MRMELQRGGSTVAALCILSLSSSVIWAQTPDNFISVTPCRVVDTRNAAGTFGGPTIAGGTSRAFPIPASACGIPANAAAFALNVTAIPRGPLIFLTIWPDGQPQPNASTLNSPSGNVIANAAIVPAGASGAVDVFVSNPADVILDISGYFVPASNASNNTSTALGTGASNAGLQNTAVGYNTLQVNAGNGNSALGANALTANSQGNNNVAIGDNALLSNAGGSANTAVGGQALLNDFGNDNTAVGFSALFANTVGINNTAIGVSTLYSNVGGSNNVAVGQNALYNMTSGASNIALGYQAGSQLTSGDSNIYIGNQGQASDGGVIRIGTAGTQTSTYMAGILNTNVSGSNVLINSNGQLGIATSSERFKEDIADMGRASDALMLLRPVTFRYKQPFEDGTKPLQYGLLSEEVAKVYPGLVVYDQDGQAQSLQYHELPALLLNELQKQHQIIAKQESKIKQQQEQMRELQERIAALEARIEHREH